jgi:hypothetical protein
MQLLKTPVMFVSITRLTEELKKLPHKSGDYYFSFYSAFLANPKHIF